MDQADLYDQFGNYTGPELESDEEEDDDEEQQHGYRQELANVDQTSDMVRVPGWFGIHYRCAFAFLFRVRALV